MGHHHVSRQGGVDQQLKAPAALAAPTPPLVRQGGCEWDALAASGLGVRLGLQPWRGGEGAAVEEVTADAPYLSSASVA